MMSASKQSLPFIAPTPGKPAYQYRDDIPRVRSFSLGDFHDFDRCVFRFFVNHHLEKKYELAEGNVNQAIGSLLDLAIKKVHQTKAYDQPIEYLENLVKAAETEMRTDVLQRGRNSFYGAQIDFLTEETSQKAKEVFKKYYQGLIGKYQPLVLTPTTKKLRPFWKVVIKEEKPVQLWGGPDAIERGGDGIPEVVDYKYMEDLQKGVGNLDMDLMPKIYILLTAQELLEVGFAKARFVVRLWQDPGNNSYYEEFNLNNKQFLEDFFQEKIDKILRTTSLTFCDKDFCPACKSPHRQQWIAQLKLKGWITDSGEEEASEDLPF
ncbi:PD-(D/E)XK nuclease family protein [Patescibacteria group bacterium]|nr:PD-(D/E)XK nuclease family protein [Patescibacteria group bacterium]MCL5410209.1 PD-(D/E)XK nuclease family protein [Patescibacteria group bacterium]